MNTNLCGHIHPDGNRCQAPPLTGRSYCFFHDKDPDQQEKRLAAQRNGGSMRGRYIEAEPQPNPLAALDLAFSQIKTTRDTVVLQEQAILETMRGNIKLESAVRFGYLVTMLFYNLKHIEDAERRVAEAEKKEAQKKEAEKKEEAAARAAAKSGVGAPGSTVGAPGFNRVEGDLSDGALAPAAAVYQGTTSASPGEPSSLRAAERSAQEEEEPIIIDGSKPIDWSQFKGKKPKITSIRLVMRDIVTGDLRVTTPGKTVIIPGNKGDRKPEASPSDTAPAAGGEVVYQGTSSLVPKRPEEDQLHSAEGLRAASGFPASPVLACWGGAERSAPEKDSSARNDEKPEEPPKPPTPPTPPPPRNPALARRFPHGKLHPWIEYWGLY